MRPTSCAATFDELGGHDGFVSIEVNPDLAHDTEGTLAQAKDLFGRLGRPNVMIKIPATREGLPAITDATAAGLNVNITLIFALERYQEVIEAYLEGLEQRVGRGEDMSGISSVASFFVSRVDTETDRRLPEGHPLRGQAAVANAKLAYQVFHERFSGPRWDDLVAAGANLQRPLWASTSTKNPAYSPTLYVDQLVGRDTVNTLAQASLDALAHDDGLRPDTVQEGLDEARAVIAGLAEAGVDFDDVTATLEREGVSAFSASYHDALEHAREEGARADVTLRSHGRVLHDAEVLDEVGGLRVCVEPARVGHHVHRCVAHRLGLPAEHGLAIPRDAIAGDADEAHRARSEPVDEIGQSLAPRAVLVRGERVARVVSGGATMFVMPMPSSRNAANVSSPRRTNPDATAAGQNRLPGRANPTPTSAE